MLLADLNRVLPRLQSQASTGAHRGREQLPSLINWEGGMKRTDAFVVFGITGDLARVMTLHSLYRLEARGLLSCPIIGVAVDDWTVDASA